MTRDQKPQTSRRSILHLRVLRNVIPPQRLIPISLPSPLQREIPRAGLPAPLSRSHSALLPAPPLPEVPLRVLREPHIPRERHDARVEELAPRADARELGAAEREQPHERDERAARRDRVLEPPEREPHDGGHAQRREGRKRPGHEHRAQPDREPRGEPVHHLVLRDLVECVPDRPRLLVPPHRERRRDEHRRPERQPRQRDEHQEGEPGYADHDSVGHERARDPPADAFVFDTDMNQEVLIFLNYLRKKVILERVVHGDQR